MSSAHSYGRTSGGHLEIAVPPGDIATLSRRLFGELEAMAKKTASIEAGSSHWNSLTGIPVKLARLECISCARCTARK